MNAILNYPIVSVIIPTYNRANDLTRAIQSIINQTFTDYEIIVIDNHSIDNTDLVVQNFNDTRINLHKIHNNGVIAASRNLGIKKSKGKYIAFLDSDDWWLPGKLEESVKALENGADIVYHDLYLVTSNNQKIYWRKVKSRKVHSPVFKDLLLDGDALPNSSVVFRKEIIDKVGFLSEEIQLVAWEDFDFWLRISKITEKFFRIQKTFGYYWEGGGNISNEKRTLRILEDFLIRYKEGLGFDKEGKVKVPWWVKYAISKIHFRRKNYLESYLELKQINSIPKNYYFKITVLKILSFILSNFSFLIIKNETQR